MVYSIRPLAALAAIPALVFSTSALASYGVAVQVSSRAGHAGPALCQYNGNASDGCSRVTGDPTSTGTLSTSGGSGALATRASASTFQTGVDYGQTQAEATSITATSDLTSGSVQMASSNTNGFGPSGYGSGGYANLNDMLHFSVAGASATTVTPITISFALDGTMLASSANAPYTGSGEFYGAMIFGSSSASFYFLDDASTNFTTAGTLTNANYSNNSGAWTSAPDFSTNHFTETYNILGTGADIPVILRASLNCGNGASCQYGNSAKLGIVTPNGTSFTSDSGVFLTSAGVAGAVPEPAIWAMMIAGFAAVGVAMRRRAPVARPFSYAA